MEVRTGVYLTGVMRKRRKKGRCGDVALGGREIEFSAGSDLEVSDSLGPMY